VPVLTSPPSPDDGVEEKSIDTSMPAFSLFNTAERATTKFSRPLFSFISPPESGQDVQLDRVNRIERIVLVIALITALVGLAIILWIWMLRPQAGARNDQFSQTVCTIKKNSQSFVWKVSDE